MRDDFVRNVYKKDFCVKYILVDRRVMAIDVQLNSRLFYIVVISRNRIHPSHGQSTRGTRENNGIIINQLFNTRQLMQVDLKNLLPQKISRLIWN